MKKLAIFATFLLLSALAATPASAKMTPCSGANMAKLDTMTSTMHDGPLQTAMGQEMELAKAEMHKGHVLRACLHMRKAQKLSNYSANGVVNTPPPKRRWLRITA